MNLSHAVAVCCYELSRPDPARGAQARNVPPASAGEVDLLAKHALKLFDKANYLTFISPARKLSKIRRALMQWNVRVTDVRLLHGIMRFLEQKAGGRGG
jgi:tRNA C32,U32 (ribose-2'-O)-methylase TrmJ